MALRGPVRESSVLLGVILNPVARGTQEKRWQRRDPDQQFPLNQILRLTGSIPSQESAARNAKRLAARAASRSYSVKLVAITDGHRRDLRHHHGSHRHHVNRHRREIRHCPGTRYRRGIHRRREVRHCPGIRCRREIRYRRELRSSRGIHGRPGTLDRLGTHGHRGIHDHRGIRRDRRSDRRGNHGTTARRR
jgi:hypothetical protein